MTTGRSGVFLGIFEGHVDPAVAAVRDGAVIAYAEEERFLRYKHAPGVYPMRALKFCLDEAGVGIDEVECVALNWDLDAYTDGAMAAFFEAMARDWPVDAQTVSWQQSLLRRFSRDSIRIHHERQWRRAFGGNVEFPPLQGIPHHYTHAFHASMESPFEDALCLTIDGSGDQHTTVLWEKRGPKLTPLREICMPHSLGWFYAAFTEYLGFDAYDGEYKVMGLASYGGPDDELRRLVAEVVQPADDGIGFVLDPTFTHYGEHTYSGRFTDRLVALFDAPPRRPDEAVTQWHMDLAYAVQDVLEEAVERFVGWGVRHTGLGNVCVGGGVGLNVKMNSRLFQHPDIDDVFAHPLCSDGGAAAGAALVACTAATGALPEPLDSLALGPEADEAGLVGTLERTGQPYERPADLLEVAATALAEGCIVGWFQGRMEAGPRALGQRSILADPRRVEARDRVNAVIKYREPWRPFCPSMPEEVASDYFVEHTSAPFMTIAFRADERLAREAPAIVHVDGTARVQLVSEHSHPLFHELLRTFGRRTGTPVLLNTSFNVKGEPIVSTPEDALRTFWATGLDVLVLGPFVIRKPGAAG